MAFEDAETLAYVLARVLASDFNANNLPDIVSNWEHHRIVSKSSPHYYEQAAKEWIIWATFKFMGPEGGAHWIVLGALA
ncbi:hypothetical protein V1524DRAFT_443146 [Lipomyces starkeyi]